MLWWWDSWQALFQTEAHTQAMWRHFTCLWAHKLRPLEPSERTLSIFGGSVEQSIRKRCLFEVGPRLLPFDPLLSNLYGSFWDQRSVPTLGSFRVYFFLLGYLLRQGSAHLSSSVLLWHCLNISDVVRRQEPGRKTKPHSWILFFHPSLDFSPVIIILPFFSPPPLPFLMLFKNVWLFLRMCSPPFGLARSSCLPTMFICLSTHCVFKVRQH